MKKKLYLILPILITICFLSFAAVCNLGQLLNNGESADQLSKEEELQKEIDALKKEEQKLEEEALKKENEENSKEDKNADDSKKEGTDKKDEKPTVTLKIYEGPTYSKSDDACYYRIEAKITGIPSPTIKFSRDDGNGAWGNAKVQINLKKGETCTLSVTATNSKGTANDSIKLVWLY
ncbi:MAG: hypothetical protein K8S14_09205 [Actinomycetia bacterium]|nr:hypothetical protein [Actinomycetes bacterium]